MTDDILDCCECEWCGGCTCGYYDVTVFRKKHTICKCCYQHLKKRKWEKEDENKFKI